MKRALRYTLKVKHMCDERLPKKAWEESNKPLETNKSKMVALGWALDLREWFKRWGVEQ